MKKIFGLLLLTICALFGFSACSLKMASVDSLIRAPKLTGDNQAVQLTLDKCVGDNITLKTPMSGEYLSAFVYRDLDNDGDSECIAFYALKNENAVHMNILDAENGKWFSVCDVTGSGSDVYALLFADVDGDNKEEILVTWSIQESKNNKYLSVYGKYAADSGVVSLVSEMFTSFHTLDVNADGSDEIFVTLLTTAGDSYVSLGRLFSYSAQRNTIEPVSEIKLDQSVTSYSNICHDYEGSDCRIYIDGIVSETHMITEVLQISAGDMNLSVASADGNPISAYTLRSGNNICADMNKDGYIEIPSYTELPCGEIIDRENSLSEKMYLTTWKRYVGGELSVVHQYFENTEDRYHFTIPNDWNGTVTAVYDKKINRLKFFELNENSEIGHMLFYIEPLRATDDVFYEHTNREGVIYSDREYIYVCEITYRGAELGFQTAELMKNFVKT